MAEMNVDDCITITPPPLIVFGIKQINGRLWPTVDWMIGSEVSSGATASVAATSVRRTETAGAVAPYPECGAPCRQC